MTEKRACKAQGKYSLMGTMPEMNNYFLKDFMYLFMFRERRREGEKEGEKHPRVRETLMGCLSHIRKWGPGLRVLTGNPA